MTELSFARTVNIGFIEGLHYEDVTLMNANSICQVSSLRKSTWLSLLACIVLKRLADELNSLISEFLRWWCDMMWHANIIVTMMSQVNEVWTSIIHLHLHSLTNWRMTASQEGATDTATVFNQFYLISQ
jgi:hypothetical protein